MKKFLSTFVLNVIFALIGVGVTIWQELIITHPHWGILAICSGASVGGSLLAEVIKIIGAERDFSVWQFLLGAAIGVAAAVIVLFAVI